VPIWTVSCSVIEVLHDHCFATCIAALEDYDGLVGLEKLHHCSGGLGFSLPLSFTLCVAVLNPRDGEGGVTRAYKEMETLALAVRGCGRFYNEMGRALFIFSCLLGWPGT
jgi:hypothetical protein